MGENTLEDQNEVEEESTDSPAQAGDSSETGDELSFAMQDLPLEAQTYVAELQEQTKQAQESYKHAQSRMSQATTNEDLARKREEKVQEQMMKMLEQQNHQQLEEPRAPEETTPTDPWATASEGAREAKENYPDIVEAAIIEMQSRGGIGQGASNAEIEELREQLQTQVNQIESERLNTSYQNQLQARFGDSFKKTLEDRVEWDSWLEVNPSSAKILNDPQYQWDADVHGDIFERYLQSQTVEPVTDTSKVASMDEHRKKQDVLSGTIGSTGVPKGISTQRSSKNKRPRTQDEIVADVISQHEKSWAMEA